MIYRFETALRSIRKLISRERFVVWLFGLSKSVGSKNTTGLIILQVDGLSFDELERALENERMPFTKKLLEKEHYHLQSVYSGIPSSTPAVQGELFYGVKACVPAFRFKRPQDKKSVIMLDSNLAMSVQRSLEKQGEPLLTGGSAYADMFDGGAVEASFCASSLGWQNLIPTGNAFKMLIFGMVNIVSVLRVIVLIIAELTLSIVDLVRGVFDGHDFFKELVFIPVRIATAVLLKEFVSIGVKLDAARGLPVIHANFLSYDEQAHRRGPDSRFAHWSLKGIDNAIARIWKSAKRSEHRDYDIWIYSDHGQEKSKGYPSVYGRSIHDAVNDVLVSYVQESTIDEHLREGSHLEDPSYQHAHLLGSQKLAGWMSRFMPKENHQTFVEFSLAAMGPLGLIYLEQKINQSTRVAIANDLVLQANVPMVVTASSSGSNMQASVWQKEGSYELPQEKAAVFGADHPFLEEVCDDLIALCHHKFAGEFILVGWRKDQDAISFRKENGAHAGPGPNETHAFALLPKDLNIENKGKPYIRFETMYRAAMMVLGKENLIETKADHREEIQADELTTHLSEEQSGRLRVLTYNVHSCIGMDGRVSPQRISRVIAMADPDIIALQEVIVETSNSAEESQAGIIANELGMNLAIHPLKTVALGVRGNAILSKHSLKLIDTSVLLTKLNPKRPKVTVLDQARGVMEVEISYGGKKLIVLNTHMGLTPEERRVQVEDLLGTARFNNLKKPSILCGDFNATRRQYTHKAISKCMQDVEIQFERLFDKKRSRKTFPAKYPAWRIDHIFVSDRFSVDDVSVPSNHLTKVASDHLPLVTDIKIV